MNRNEPQNEPQSEPQNKINEQIIELVKENNHTSRKGMAEKLNIITRFLAGTKREHRGDVE